MTRKGLPASIQGTKSEVKLLWLLCNTKMFSSLTFKAGAGCSLKGWFSRLISYWKEAFSSIKEIHRVNSQRCIVKEWLWERSEQDHHHHHQWKNSINEFQCFYKARRFKEKKKKKNVKKKTEKENRSIAIQLLILLMKLWLSLLFLEYN